MHNLFPSNVLDSRIHDLTRYFPFTSTDPQQWPSISGGRLGDKVKVFARVGHMKESKWISGEYLDDVPRGSNIDTYSMVKISGDRVIMVPANKVKKHVKIDKNCAWWNENWEELKRTVSLGMEQVLKSKYELKMDEEEHIIYADGENFSIGPSILERESLTQFREMACWSISITSATSATYWEPGDVDVNEISKHEFSVNAAREFIKVIWEEDTRPFWDSLTPELPDF